MDPSTQSRAQSTASIRRRRLRVASLVGVGIVYLVSIPWYRESGGALQLIAGLPDWVSVAFGSYCLAAVLNCFAWLLTDVDDTRDVSDVPRAAHPTVESAEEVGEA
jgi:hypothetical protein